MLVVRVFQWVSQSKKSVQLTAGSILAALAVSTLWLLFQVSPESIPCHSDQLIKNAEYYVMPTESKARAVSEYRDVEYDQYNTILLTGSEDVSHLIAKIHKTAQTMENRTKGYDIKIGKCSSMEMMKYFLVLEIEKSSETVLYTRNRGWQANSDVFSIFCDRLEISEIKKREPQSLVNLVFNKISLGVDEDETEVVLGILHNIHNLYSHSLGVYFYWVVGDKAIFLSSNVLLILVLGVFLIFLEFVTGGSFAVNIFETKNIFRLLGLLGYDISFFFFSVDLIFLSFFESFLIYCVLVPLHFPVAVILGGYRVLFFFCELIGCSDARKSFLLHFDLLHETIGTHESAEHFLSSSASDRDTDEKQVQHTEQSH